VTALYRDSDIAGGLDAAAAVRWMGEAVDAHHRGELIAPPRARAELGDGRLVFTAGRLRGSWFGYRSYDTFPAHPGAQVVVVHDESSGQVRAIAIGNELGPRRTGAIGAVAADALAPAGAGTVAVIGSGVQAYTQVWALSAVRRVAEVRVYSRDPSRRAAFAQRIEPLVDGVGLPVSDAREAVTGAEIVILATSSPVPVIDVAWIGPGSYVSTLGPKQHGRAEFGLDLPAAAALLVTDSPAQIAAYDPPNVLAGTPHQQRLVSLGAVRAGEVPAPAADGITVFFSAGLAGTEAFLLDRLAYGAREA
jgi:ornithine cyclodeaminase/alanine dehydrogenase-like protein (mu-crystallin family)